MRDNVMPQKVCIECHGDIRSTDLYLYIPSRKHTRPVYRHADCHAVCGALGEHLPSAVRLGEMLDAWQMLRKVIPPNVWADTESLQLLERSMAYIHERMDVAREG